MQSPEQPARRMTIDDLPEEDFDALARWLAMVAVRRAREARAERLAREAAQQPTPPANGQPAASEAA